MKVLISAYACEPDRGSEPGAGWNWALAAARRHEVWVLTRANNRAVIERGLSRSTASRLHFEYLDLPRWARWWKRGPRGARLYYVLWQILAARRARRLQREEGFDLVHHLTFANVWLPALAWLGGGPFVLGPVGGGQRVPLCLYPVLGVRGAGCELLLRIVHGLVRSSPPVRLGWKQAAVILVNNEQTQLALPRAYRAKVLVRPNASVPDEIHAVRRSGNGSHTAVCAGRLNRFKAVALAIEALSLAPRWSLTVVGEGPDAERLRRIARRSGVLERVRFVPWLAQRDLWRLIADSRALVLPSLKEGASFVAAEAQALGVPVVAFEGGGAAALAGAAGARFELVPLGSRRDCVRGLAGALARLEDGTRASSGPAEIELERIAEDLDNVYRLAVSGAASKVAE